MTSARETIYAALFAKFSGLSGIKSASRRLVEYQQVGDEQQPALFMLQVGENAQKTTGMPTKWTLRIKLYIWIATGNDIDGTIPAQIINPIMDTLEAALDPTAPDGWYQDLGVLGVTEARINGEVTISEGTGGSQAEVMIPIEVIAV